MSAKTNLKFDKFQNFACQAQQNMRSNEFCDVTLVSADNSKFVAHKVILAAYSDIFKNMLVNEKHPHPLIFLRGVKGEVLGALLDFIYCGEAQINNEDLDLFIQLSTDIKLNKEALKTETKSAREKEEIEGKVCKHWNRGYCKQENCNYLHSNSDCEYHLSGRKCRKKNCHKRHRITCKYWYWHEDGCKRKGKCAYLHQKTYESEEYCEKRSRDRSLDTEISENRGRDEGRRRECRERNNSKERSKRRHLKRRTKSSSCEENQSDGSFDMSRLERWEN